MTWKRWPWAKGGDGKGNEERNGRRHRFSCFKGRSVLLFVARRAERSYRLDVAVLNVHLFVDGPVAICIFLHQVVCRLALENEDKDVVGRGCVALAHDKVAVGRMTLFHYFWWGKGETEVWGQGESCKADRAFFTLHGDYRGGRALFSGAEFYKQGSDADAFFFFFFFHSRGSLSEPLKDFMEKKHQSVMQARGAVKRICKRKAKGRQTKRRPRKAASCSAKRLRIFLPCVVCSCVSVPPRVSRRKESET